jgi:chemotaxis protein methyltransferase CheR
MTMGIDVPTTERFRGWVAARLGLHFDDTRQDYLVEVLRARILANAPATAEGYIERLSRSGANSEEVRALAEALTVNETFFFRNPDAFRAVTVDVLEPYARGEGGDRRLRILSLGCSSGEEPYSLAIAARETLPADRARNVEIIGVDLSPGPLAKASRARYSAWALRATPDVLRSRYFKAESNELKLDDAIRTMVAFREQNLSDPASSVWSEGPFDVVFCRNVLMYMTPEAMRAIVARIGRALRPEGLLFLGHAETLRGLSDDYHLRHAHETFYYQKKADVPAGANGGYAAHAGRAGAVDWVNGARVANSDATEDLAWASTIRRASERIAALVPSAMQAQPSGAPASAPARTKPSELDLGSVHEALRQERFSDALTLLSLLPTESRTDPETLLLHAVLLTNSGNHERAESACRRLLEIDELNAGAHYVMALCRDHAGDAASALEHDRTAAYLDRDFAMPHLHMGLLARRDADAEAARRELSLAFTLLATEEPSRVLLFGGGFSRDALLDLCRAELRAAGGEP